MASSYTEEAGTAVLSVLCCACNFVDIPCGKKVIAFIQEILLVPTSSFSMRLRVWIHQNSSSFGCTWFVSLMCLLMRWGQPLLQGAQWSRSGQPAQAGTRKTPARCSENHFTIGVLKYGNRLPRRHAESASLKILEAHPVEVLGSLLWLDVRWVGVFPNGLQGSLPV